MNDKHKKIEPEKLEVGMNVAYPYTVDVGWYRVFRYPMWVVATVKRVTSKRTKVVLTRETGATIEVNLKKEAVYEIDADMARENECVGMYKVAHGLLIDYENNKWRSLWELSDEELKNAHTFLMELDGIMRKEN